MKYEIKPEWKNIKIILFRNVDEKAKYITNVQVLNMLSLSLTYRLKFGFKIDVQKNEEL